MLSGLANSKKDQQSDDDDDFFKPTSTSSLSKIFGIAKQPETDVAKPHHQSLSSAAKLSDRYGASSFRYVPPQEIAKPDDEDGKLSSEWSLVQASVVTAYKLINTENVAQGKLGLALLRSCSEFRIIIYRTKTDALATLNVAASTKLFLKNNYVQFRSDDEYFWSVLFEAPAERISLLAAIEGICTIDQDKIQTKPIPASRTIPLVEEPDSDADKGRSSLLSRIARVGQSILPHDKLISTTEVSDSSDTDARIETIPRSSIPPHRRSGSNSKIHPVTIGMQMVPSAANALSTAIAGQSMLQTATDVNYNLFMTETRMQGTEVRMNLSKLESKLDRVLDKMDLLNLNSYGGKDEKRLIDRDEDILALEEKILELKKENHTLKRKMKNLETQSVAIREDLMAKERLNQVEQECHELKKTIEILQKDIQASQQKISEDTKQIETLNRELEVKNQTIDNKAKELSMSDEQLRSVLSEKNSLHEQNLSLVKQLDNLQQTMNSLEVNLANQKASINDTTHLNNMVKDIMNNCFQRLCEQLDDEKVLRVIGQTIKYQTKIALQRQHTE